MVFTLWYIIYKDKMSKQTIQPNKYIELDIRDLGANGEGIGEYEEYTVFVPFALPSERVKVQVEHIKKNLVFAKLVDVISKSRSRREVLCNRFTKCGGCDLLHLSYEEQLEYKKQMLSTSLSKMIGKVSINKTVPSIPSIRYRNKIQIPFGKISERVVLGFYKPKTHSIVSITKCFLQDEVIDKLLNITLDFANENNFSVYENGKGLLRYLVARYIDNGLFVTLVINGNSIPNINKYYKTLVANFNKVSLTLCINKAKTNVILSNKIVEINSNIEKTNYMGLNIDVHPLSFLQVNDYIAEKIYQKIIAYVKERQIECVIDAYSGIGLLGALISKNSNAKIINIDIVKEAIDDANKLVKINSLKGNIENICADSKDVLQQILDKNKALKTLLVVDPPRKGLSDEVSSVINNLDSNLDLIYISCNPATLARDLSRLSNFNIISITPYDMFAQTYHIETLVFLTKKSKI